MKKFISALLVLCIAGITGCAKKPKKEVIAAVNGKEITMAMLDYKIENLPPYYQTFASQHKKEVLDEMITEQLLYKEALRRKLNHEADVKELIEEATKKVLISRIIEDEAKKSTPVSEDDVKTHYEQNKERYMIPEMVRASHILTNTEEEAKKAKAELDAGADFAEVAKKYSKDLTKERGGDLGYFKKGQMIPEFENAVFDLDVGETSDVVKTRFGYHIIKVVDHKPATYRNYDEIKDSMMQLLTKERQMERFDELTKRLKAKAKIKINDSLLISPQEENTMPKAPEGVTKPAKQD